MPAMALLQTVCTYAISTGRLVVFDLALGAQTQGGGNVMAVEVRIPTILRTYTGGERVVTASGDSVQAVVGDLNTSFPGIAERLIDDSGLRRFVNVYLNDEDVRFLEGLSTPVAAGDSITILPAVAGG